MTNKGNINSFGLDPAIIKRIDWDKAVERVLHDMKSDFIYAPHLRYIFKFCSAALIDIVKKELSSGTYSVELPLTIEVPKSSRLRVAHSKSNPGPSYSRPGSILSPKDRLLYQVIGDEAAAIVQKSLDWNVVFSHQISNDADGSMFIPVRTCWKELQTYLKESGQSKDLKYVIKLDIADYFGSINQHVLINTLTDFKLEPSLCNRLEQILIQFTGNRSSRGILQGLFTSDLLGNFYMKPVDQFISEQGYTFARYVDDLYIFCESISSASELMRALIVELRSYDLTISEGKSYIIAKHLLVTEEPDLEELFAEAIAETSKSDGDNDYEGYGFQMDWDDDDEDDAVEEENTVDIELRATENLFDSIDDYQSHEESIERFCIPIFQRESSDYAIDHILRVFVSRPSMAQIYASYLSSFIDDEQVYDFLVSTINDDSLVDWQRMWVLAALLKRDEMEQLVVSKVYRVLSDPQLHDGLRAVAAIIVGRYGDAARRRSLNKIYAAASEYVRSAIFISSVYWNKVERANARAQWGGHGYLNDLIAIGMSRKK